jgi:hypothetical protein
MADGNWRRVLNDGEFAIKIPRPDRPKLAAGARSLNLFEWELWTVWRPRYAWDYLCPAIRCSADGTELVMRAAVPCGREHEQALKSLWDDIQRRYPYVAPLGECKVADWGVLGGRFVLLDYGAECDSAMQVSEARATLARHVQNAERTRTRA